MTDDETAAAVNPLVVIETHPVPYRAPVYRCLQTRLGIPVTVIYGSDLDVVGGHRHECSAKAAEDAGLLGGYTARFLSTAKPGGPRRLDHVAPRGIADALRHTAPGAILLTGISPWFHQAAFFAARRLGAPLLFRGETTDHARRRSWARTVVRDDLLRWVYGHCARLLYIGRRSHEHFRRLGAPESRLIFAPYCVDTTPFRLSETDRVRLRATTRQALGVGDAQRIILFAGRLVPRKHPDLLLDAVRRLPATQQAAVVVAFLGDGPMAASLAQQAGCPPVVQARFLGFQHQLALSPYYHAADLLVLPSREGETWGLVVNEALHHGLPCVVSTGVGCAPDLVVPGVTGDLFSTGDAEGLAAALQRAFQLTESAEVRARCRAQVEGHTVERAAQGIAAAYQAATGAAHRRARRPEAALHG